MDRSLLAARIQDILKGKPRPARPEIPAPGTPGPTLEANDEEAAFAARCAADEVSAGVAEILGAAVLESGSGGSCLVIEHRYPAHHAHGRATVERYASAAAAAAHVVPSFLAAGSGLPLDADPGRPLLFFDIETTGLSGGAGTYAFLVGCGRFDGADFITRQYFLRGYGEEVALLEAVRRHVEPLAAADGDGAPACLVTYNGRSFDIPVMETRYLFHRRTSPFGGLAHVDMLFPARRVWKRRRGRAVVPATADPLAASCALTALEQDILGLERQHDVPGWEIPARYFAYARTGQAAGLVPVLEHNRLDLLSLGAVTALIMEMVVEQEHRARDPHECVGLARLLEYLGRGADAERCYERAAAATGLIEGEVDRAARADALHWLATRRRRARRFVESADAWRALLLIPGLRPDMRREACEALAIHHEHRARDFDVARSFALRALESARGGRGVPEVEHRLDRLSRKIAREGSRPQAGEARQGTLPG